MRSVVPEVVMLRSQSSPIKLWEEIIEIVQSGTSSVRWRLLDGKPKAKDSESRMLNERNEQSSGMHLNIAVPTFSNRVKKELARFFK